MTEFDLVGAALGIGGPQGWVSNPNGDCASKHRVAVLGYLGKDSVEFPTQQGADTGFVPAVYDQPVHTASMSLRCDYCLSESDDDVAKCSNCGAPVSHMGPGPDYRRCPFCSRKLLALASPACSYCGRRLPEDYINAREADLRRMDGIAIAGKQGGMRGNTGSLDAPVEDEKKPGALKDLPEVRD